VIQLIYVLQQGQHVQQLGVDMGHAQQRAEMEHKQALARVGHRTIALQNV